MPIRAGIDDVQAQGAAAPPGAARTDGLRRGVAPLVFSSDAAADAALERLAESGQALAFVACEGNLVGVVTTMDLGFAVDCAGPAATVGDATTLGLVEIGHGSDVLAATQAYGEGLRRWVGAHR